MSLGEVREPCIVFGEGKKNSRQRSCRRAAIARWAIANQLVGDAEVDVGSLTPVKIRAFREMCMSGSPLAEDCDVAVGDLVLDDGGPDDGVAMAIDRIVDAINMRVRSRHKEF